MIAKRRRSRLSFTVYSDHDKTGMARGESTSTKFDFLLTTTLTITECLKKYKQDPEMLQKSSRPCVLILKLRYKGVRYHFAVPLRSNINPSTPKEQYFPLPPRPSTQHRYRHGIHYIKMFPVHMNFLNRYRTEGNEFATLIKQIIDKNEKRIIKECQQYLTDYENGIRSQYSTDIDLLIKIMSGH